MISSTSNSRIKKLVTLNKKAKFRREEGAFIVEGEKMFLEAPKEWIKEVYISETFLNKCKNSTDKNLKEAVYKTGFEVLTDEVFQKVSDTQTPQGILCVLSMPQYALKEYIKNWRLDKKNVPLILLLEDLQDPGNLGTIFRTGEGAGVSGIIMTGQTVDLFNPKTIRSTMGSIYRVPFFTVEELDSTIQTLKQSGVAVYAAYLENSMDYDLLNYTQPTAFVIGNESNGLRRTTADKATQYIKIPMAGQVESLNAAVAASILMYEAARQKKYV